MTRKIVDIAVIIPDASPVLTLARINRLDLFETFSPPIEIVHQFTTKLRSRQMILKAASPIGFSVWETG
jgi:hypothetical protein